jgi:hypothetical protein
VGKITPQKLPSLKGLVNLQSGAPKPEENPSLNIQFKIQQLAISGKDKLDNVFKGNLILPHPNIRSLEE